MVGRLVEQQHVRILSQRSRYRCPSPFTATRSGDRSRKVNAELIGDRGCFMSLGSILTLEDPVLKCLGSLHFGILLEENDMGARDDGALSFICIDQLCKAFEKRGFAGAVSANKSEPVTFADVKVKTSEQPALALDQSKVFVG
jgi:hypothetical protein